ncbi:MAG TPA: LCP family protein [Pseudonocardia sp.]|jgi:LCP family protein required for cell wall assembly|nr:LCP family protein [Pseudonocardia sp.]
MRRATGVKTVVALLSAMVLIVTGYGWREYRSLSSGLTRSGALDGVLGDIANASGGQDTNILIMGLDSRLDQNGDPLPKDVLAQLHAGDSNDGGYNTNVLMLLHVPGDGSRAQAISIPRDDYAELPGAPDNVNRAKIKQGYGLAKDEKERQLRSEGVRDPRTLEQQGREAGRRQTVKSVQEFLGGVPIDHFVEVTLVGFYDLASALGSVKVCLKGPTQDSYSGAKFVRGYQDLNAAQALAFVRQRRDYRHPELNFTDLDRERRQQAFLAAASYQLRSLGTFTDPTRLASLIDVAKKDVVIDNRFDLLGFLQESKGLLNGNITFTTLPVKSFGKRDGQDVNLVDTDQIRTLVQHLLNPGDSPDGPAPAPPAAPAQLPAATVEVVNATGRDGLATTMESLLADRGLTRGAASTHRRLVDQTELRYAPDAADSATALANLLGGISSTSDSSLRKGHERLTLGTDFTMPAELSSNPAAGTDDDSSAGASAPHPPAVAASSINGGGVPCVK